MLYKSEKFLILIFFWFQFCIVMSSLSNLNLHYHLQSVHWNLYWKCDPQMVNWKIVSTCSYLFNLCKYKFHISNTSLYMYWVLVTVINSLNCIMSMHANKQTKVVSTQSLNTMYQSHTRKNMHSNIIPTTYK